MQTFISICKVKGAVLDTPVSKPSREVSGFASPPPDGCHRRPQSGRYMSRGKQSGDVDINTVARDVL